MIEGAVTQPDILAALARAGHTDMVLIADGHFPGSTAIAAQVPRVYLNLAPGLLTVPQVLRPVARAIPLESATAAVHDDGSEPVIWPEFQASLPAGTALIKVRSAQFLALVASPGLALAIMTGDVRSFACIVLTIGHRRN